MPGLLSLAEVDAQINKLSDERFAIYSIRARRIRNGQIRPYAVSRDDPEVKRLRAIEEELRHLWENARIIVAGNIQVVVPARRLGRIPKSKGEIEW